MITRKKLVGMLLVGLVVAGLAAGSSMALAQGATPPGPITQRAGAMPAMAAFPADGPALVVSTSTMTVGTGADKSLAQALGISEDALQAAHIKAHDAAILAAVKAGQLTQQQGNALSHGLPGPFIDYAKAGVDPEKLLADALGITTDRLDAAQEAAAQADLAQAVKDGRMTQQDADRITGQQALSKYVADKGLFASTVNAAVKDGALTQAQADALLSQPQIAFGGGMVTSGFVTSLSISEKNGVFTTTGPQFGVQAQVAP